MWDTLWTDARLATMSPEGAPFGAIEPGAIAVKDSIIAWVGTMADLPGTPERLARIVHSAEGRWITPGLMDCHTHLVYAGNRFRDMEMRLQGASRADIERAGGGILQTVKLTRSASAETLLDEVERRLAALASEGVTTIEIKSGYGLDLETELKSLRVAQELGRRLPVTVQTTFGAYVVAPEYKDRPDEYVDFLCKTVIPEVARKGLAEAVDVQLDEKGFSCEQATRIFESASALGLAIRVHTDELSDFDGTTFAARYRARTADHLEYVSEKGVAAMARTGTVAVLLPGSTYTLRASRTPPVELFRMYGVPMAISTNCNPGPSPVTSLLMILNMACTLFRITPEEALAGATRNASAALGLAATHGTLETGKTADFVLWDIESPKELVYYIGLNPCALVVYAGKVVRGIGASKVVTSPHK